MKTYTILQKVVLVFILLVYGCSGTPSKPTKVDTDCISNKPSMDWYLDKISSQKTTSPGSKIYTFFLADRCKECPGFKKRVESLNLDGEVIFLNVELTWAFLISRQLGVTGIPTVVVFVNGNPVVGQTGADNIFKFLDKIKGL